jgi:hypothetical protein
MVGYYFRNVALPSHMYSYNLIFEPPLIFNDPYENKYFSVAIRPAPKIKNLPVSNKLGKCIQPKYFLSGRVYQAELYS